MIVPCTLRRACALAAATVVSISSALAQVVVNDAFTDTDRIGGLPGVSTTTSSPVVSAATAANTQWVCNKTGSFLVASGSGLNWVQDGTSNNLITGYFPAASLATTGTLKLTLNFTTGTLGAGANQLALAFVDGSPAGYRTTDGISSSDGTYGGDLGYRINIANFGTTASLPQVAIQRRSSPASTNLLGSSGDWTTLGSSVTAASGSAFQSATAYTLTITLKRISAADVELTASLTGGTLNGLSVTAHDTTGNVWNNFDQFTLRTANGTTQIASVNLKSLSVDLTPSGGPIAPTIDTPPASQTVVVGEPAAFSVVASGTGPLTYQWQKDLADIGGATLSTYSIASTQLADAGNYRVIVSNAGGSTPSAAATLTVEATATPPTVTVDPVNRTVGLNGSTTFGVTATGTAPLTYQWRHDTVAISAAANPSAATATLSLTNLQVSDGGSYDVVVSNSAGSDTSAAATLTVVEPPVIDTPPASQTVAAGTPANFSVTASGAGTLTYQWRKNGTAIGGATGTTYSIPATNHLDAANYDVVVTNLGGSTTSAAATLTVNSPPVIVTPPASQPALVGASVTLTVGVGGSAPFTYQWRKGTGDLPGATGASLTLTNLQTTDAGSYDVVVTNAYGSATSAAAVLTVTPGLPSSAYNLYGFATLGGGTTGGGIIPETDPAYRKCATPLEFITAIRDANKTANVVKVIEITADLNLGWNEIDAATKALTSNPIRAHATPKLHPTLIASGVSLLDIQPKNGLTIFSADGRTIKHVTWNIKNCSNIIIRNLRFDEMWEWDEATKGDYDSNDWDFMVLSNGGAVTNVWVDHCTFTKAYDGISDMKKGTQYVTYSWCKYIGDDGATNPNSPVRLQVAALEANKSSYPFYNFLRTKGFSQEEVVQIIQGHDKAHLMGATEKDAENNVLSATFHHQWFTNMWDRCVPRLRGGQVHNYNILVDDSVALVAKRLRDARANAMSAADKNTLNNTYSFNPFLNGSISTEGGAILVEKSIYQDCLTPLRNNQTDVNDPTYTGKIKSVDSIYIFHNVDGTTTTIRGDSTDAGSPMGPFQAAIIPFSWNTSDGSRPYPAPPMDDPAGLAQVLEAGAGAGTVVWDKANWLKTFYSDSAPSILTPPASQTVHVGENATFTVTAAGSGTLTYQWRKDTNPIAGAMSATFTITGVTTGDAGSYDVIVSNAVGSIPSAAAVLTVDPSPVLPVIQTPPANQTVAVGTTATFDVVASGTPPLTYQWQKGTTDIPGATNATFAIPNAQPADAGNYRVVVSNSAGSTPSTSATLAVLNPPVIDTPPASQTVAAGADVTLTVAASGSPTLTYQWFKDSNVLGGATTSSLVLDNVQSASAGSYTVTVTNSVGSATSSAAVITVNAPPAITSHPASQTVAVGADVTLTVGVAGSAPFTYQWRKGPTPLGTGASLMLEDVAESDSGIYDVVVTNAFGSATSNGAAVLVQVPGAGDLYVAPAGVAGAAGTIEAPTTLADAITRVPAGSTIWMRGGTYVFSAQVTVARDNVGGSESARKKIFAYANELPVLDFSTQPYGSDTALNGRGLQINGHYWHVRGLEVKGSADNGIFVAGNYNIIERCVTHRNRDTGLQISRYSSSAPPEQWPAYNLILNCESYDNYDSPPLDGENADGFACKLTSGPGNVFRGCVAHHNIDDGWDLFTNSNGPIGPVVIDQCIAYSNGTLTNGTSNSSGDRNGFKLGGEGHSVAHTVTRSIAFLNGKNGFTWNSNPGPILMANNLAWNNAQGNFKFDNASTATFRNNVSIWTSGSGTNDRYGGNSGAPTGATNCFWFNGTAINAAGLVANTADFVTLATPASWPRLPNGDLDLGNFAKLAAASDLINKGEIPPGTLPFDAATYYYGLPDLGARELPAPAVAPTISTHPASQNLIVGAPLALSVSATGTAPFTYQWRKATVNLEGATGATLDLGAAALDEAGSYDAIVTNSAGFATSNTAVITVSHSYASWASGYGLAAGTAGDDTDGDGLNNLGEFGLNTSPVLAGTAGRPTLTLEGGQWIFRYTRPKWTSGISYTVQTSDALGSWAAAPNAPVVESTTATTETITLVIGDAPRRFVRLLITSP